MEKFSLTQEFIVPSGAYCCDYGNKEYDKPCEYISERTSYVGWEDGMGSPGTITHYTCEVFRTALETTYPYDGFYGLTLKKFNRCRLQRSEKC